MQAPPSVCFASSSGFPGCVSSCRNAAAVLGGEWAELGDGALPAAVLEADLVVLSSWSPAYKPLLERRGRAVVPRWHSPLLQTELSREGWKLRRIVELLDAGQVAAVAVNDDAVARALGRERVVVFPDVLDESEYAGVQPLLLEGVNVSLFGEAHARKSLLVQSAAFEELRRSAREVSWTLHLAGQTRRHPGYRSWLELARIAFVDHGFLERSRYLALVAGMDAGLAATLSESFGYVAADHLALGVPAVLSRAVACARAEGLTVSDPSDVDDVAACLRRSLDRPELAAAARDSLRERAAANAERARSALAELIDRVAT